MSIGAAITAAQPGDRILVRPGLYQEGLVIDKPLELIGDGPVQDIEVHASGRNALLFRANIARVANLTLRQLNSEDEWFAVDIAQGRLELEGCDISSQSRASILIRNGADPRVRRNRIHDGQQGGVLVQDSGLGTLEDNDITANRYSGVMILTGGNPTVRRNAIRYNRQAGVLVADGGLGTLEDNEITNSGYAGVEIRHEGNPILRGNRINHNGTHAIWIHSSARGTVEDNDLRDNAQGPWSVAEDSEPYVKSHGNREE
jgi:F-box protein 11